MVLLCLSLFVEGIKESAARLATDGESSMHPPPSPSPQKKTTRRDTEPRLDSSPSTPHAGPNIHIIEIYNESQDHWMLVVIEFTSLLGVYSFQSLWTTTPCPRRGRCRYIHTLYVVESLDDFAKREESYPLRPSLPSTWPSSSSSLLLVYF